MPKPSFWEVARRPKWVGGLALALLVAIAFSLLMQWQLSRTFNTVGVSVEEIDPVPLQTLTQPNLQITQPVFDRLVTASVEIDPDNAFVVGNRLQLVGDQTVSGYWLVTNSLVDGAALTLALGFSESLDQVLVARAELQKSQVEIVGYLEPAEPPRESQGEALGSVSLAQLANLYSPSPIDIYPAYVIVQEGIYVGLDKITIGIRQESLEINWLTAFYAIEWAFFALAAFYLWWRMVQDQVVREREGAN
jgi:cytochrome oxidase assembly protein ShyY1